MSVAEEKSGGDRGGLVGRCRRRWSEAQKRQIVAETHEPGVSVPMVAQRYNLNANQISGGGGCFARLSAPPGRACTCRLSSGAVPDPEAGAGAMHPPSEDAVVDSSPATGRIEIVLAGGCRVIVDQSVDGPALARVIAVLERR